MRLWTSEPRSRQRTHLRKAIQPNHRVLQAGRRLRLASLLLLPFLPFLPACRTKASGACNSKDPCLSYKWVSRRLLAHDRTSKRRPRVRLRAVPARHSNGNAFSHSHGSAQSQVYRAGFRLGLAPVALAHHLHPLVVDSLGGLDWAVCFLRPPSTDG